MTSVSSNLPSVQGLSSSPSLDPVADLVSQLATESVKNQLRLIRELADKGQTGLEVLLAFLVERRGQFPTIADGSAYQILVAAQSEQVVTSLQAQFPQGIVPMESVTGVDYLPLQQALAAQDFQTADRLTLQALCELAGSAAVQRKWLYFSEVKTFPVTDLRTIDTLWRIYSEDKFGFSIQRQLWLSVGKNWDALWVNIGWKSGNEWTRYPQGFTWNLSAPRGHLPLSNQLRGVQVLASLLNHPAWDT